MRLVSYQTREEAKLRFGWLTDGLVYDGQRTAAVFGYSLPSSMLEFLQLEEAGLTQLREVAARVEQENIPRDHHVDGLPLAVPAAAIKLAAPLPNPGSFRDFYAFEQHVKTARARRGLAMIPEWYEIPVFYFSNPHAITGPEDSIRKPAKTAKLDFELEIACIIGKRGSNIKPQEADAYIAGFTILNDWSARDIQQQEMPVGLGPAKGKDFATSIGPWLVTLDELADRKAGNGYDLQMTAKINGQEVSRGNMQDLYWTFGQMIARASEDVALLPGDLIGSGTVGSGCILEIGEENVQWLQPGDVIELEIERLGTLRNQIQVISE